MNAMSEACRYEADVIYAAANDAWSESLRAHVASCEECAATAAVGPWMSGFARIDERERPLPDPAVLWLKAKLMQGSNTMERATQPITRLQIAAYLVIASGWAALLMWKGSALMAWFDAFKPNRIVSVPVPATLSITVLFAAVGLLSATVMLAFHTVLAEE